MSSARPDGWSGYGRWDASRRSPVNWWPQRGGTAPGHDGRGLHVRFTEDLGPGGHSDGLARILPSGIVMKAAGSTPHWNGFLVALA